jgi:hypothetical protein
VHTDGGAGSQVTLTRIGYASPASAVKLSIANYGSQVVVSWPSGTLQESGNVSGGYTNVVGATSPYTNSVSGSAAFFRALVQ